MYVGNQMVSGTTLQTNMAATRTVIMEVKYISSKNVVIHSENCKVEIPLDITAQQLSKKICRMTGIYEAIKSKCYQKSNIFKISWQQLKNQFGS